MTRKPNRFTFTSAFIAAVSLFAVACKKEVKSTIVFPDDRALSATQTILPQTLVGVLGTGHAVADTMHLVAGAGDYFLRNLVYVDSGDVLVIPPGVTIKGILSTNGGFTPGGGLVITRYAKIEATGTADQPIVFTSASSTPKSGDWSGVIILGNASSNHASRVLVEGIPPNPAADATFGGTTGTNDAHSSGHFQYVRIEYAGYELTPNNQINGLTLAGVGSGTDIDHVCVVASKDDGIELFGGTVNLDSVIVADSQDDLFACTNGYRGTISYALGLTDTLRADNSQSNGIECTNDAIGTNSLPRTRPIIRYTTIIGLRTRNTAIGVEGLPSGTGRYGRAVHLDNNTAFDIDRSIFIGYNFGIDIDTALGNSGADYRSNFTTWLTNTSVHAYYNSGGSINSTFITSSSGNPATGGGFSTTTPAAFLNWALTPGLGNFSYVNVNNSNAGTLLQNPYSRSAANNYRVIPLAPNTTRGVFPDGSASWATGNWVKLRMPDPYF